MGTFDRLKGRIVCWGEAAPPSHPSAVRFLLSRYKEGFETSLTDERKGD